MEKKYWIIIGLIVLIIIAGVIWYSAAPESFKASFSPEGTEEGVPEGAGDMIDTSDVFPTRKEVPANVSVPEPETTGGDSNVAVPKTSVPAAPGVDAKLRTFEILASGSKYSPSTVIVNIGDTVHINFRAEGGTYDIVFPDYGLRQQAKSGETKIVEFQAITDGEFTFYCENACPKGSMKGTLIVVPS